MHAVAVGPFRIWNIYRNHFPWTDSHQASVHRTHLTKSPECTGNRRASIQKTCHQLAGSHQASTHRIHMTTCPNWTGRRRASIHQRISSQTTDNHQECGHCVRLISGFPCIGGLLPRTDGHQASTHRTDSLWSDVHRASIRRSQPRCPLHDTLNSFLHHLRKNTAALTCAQKLDTNPNHP